jgi:hypothetical protein
MRHFTNSPVTAVSLSSFDRALAKYTAANKTRRPPSGKRLAQAAYAAESHVTVTYAELGGVMMRIETSRRWGVVTTPCKEIV